jgi:O-antigen ligase
VASPTARQVFDEQTVKLGISGTSVEDAGDSLELRTLKSDIALEIFKSSPVFGVGPGEYGVSFWNVQESADAPAYYSAEDHRAIVENVYAQVLAELGVVGFLSFAMLMLWYFARLRRVSAIDLALLIAILVGLTTQGSWIGVPVWILLAYLSSTIRNDGKSLKRSNVAGDNTEYPHSSSLRCMTK